MADGTDDEDVVGGEGLARVTWSVKDTIPTVPYGSVQLFCAVQIPCENTPEARAAAIKHAAVEAEEAVKVERGALQNALDPSVKFSQAEVTKS